MKNKNLITLWLWYLAGIAIASKFFKKDKSKKYNSSVEEFGDNFVQIHKNFFSFINDSAMTDENKKILNEYKDKVLAQIELFKKEAKDVAMDLKKKWIVKKDEIEAELHKIYEKRADYIDEIKVQWEDLYEEVKEAVLEFVKGSKAKLKETYKETKAKLK